MVRGLVTSSQVSVSANIIIYRLLGHCFTIRVPQSIVWGSARNSGIKNINFKIPPENQISRERSWGICLAIGNTGVIYLRYQLSDFS